MFAFDPVDVGGDAICCHVKFSRNPRQRNLEMLVKMFLELKMSIVSFHKVICFYLSTVATTNFRFAFELLGSSALNLKVCSNRNTLWFI